MAELKIEKKKLRMKNENMEKISALRCPGFSRVLRRRMRPIKAQSR